jgi:hypothetical protein
MTEWSAVVYMTPDAPYDAGTNTYIHKELKIEKDSEGTPEQIQKLNDDSRNYNKWYLVDSVGNKFNRCILFKGKSTVKNTNSIIVPAIKPKNKLGYG